MALEDRSSEDEGACADARSIPNGRATGGRARLYWTPGTAPYLHECSASRRV